MNSPKLAFELTPVRLLISKILPIRKLDDPAKQFARYSTILTSIREVGMIEPLMVHPQKGATNVFLLMDGHLRLHALKALGHKEADCLLSTDDEGFTYNARINRIPAIQEHFMICKAVQNGVSPERIAAALDRKPAEIYGLINLLNGIHQEAAELLKDKPVFPKAVCLMRRVTVQRQIEIAELMISANNFTEGYAEALVFGTSKSQLVRPDEPKMKKGLGAEEIARMQAEMEALEHDFRAIEQSYGANVLNFTVTKNYLKKMLENTKVTKFLSSKHPDLFSEFQAIIAMEAI